MHQLSVKAAMSMTSETPSPPPPIDNLSGSENAVRMEKRIKKVETELAAIKLDVGIIKATCATKSDIAELRATMSAVKIGIILWIVITVVLPQILPGLLKKFGLM